MEEAPSLFRVVDLDNETYVSVENRGASTAYLIKMGDSSQAAFVVEIEEDYAIVKFPGQNPVQLDYTNLYHLDSVCRILFGAKDIYSLEKRFMTLPPNCT
jgi:hypothetical protein